MCSSDETNTPTVQRFDRAVADWAIEYIIIANWLIMRRERSQDGPSPEFSKTAWGGTQVPASQVDCSTHAPIDI